MSTAELRCPGCRALMEPAAAAGHCIAGCMACGGVWLDNAASQVVAQASMHPDFWNLVRSYDGVEGRRARRESYRDAATPERACPICAEHLVPSRSIGTIVVDVCAADGTFFDQNEVQAIHNAVAMGQAKTDEQAEMRRRALKATEALERRSWYIDLVLFLLD